MASLALKRLCPPPPLLLKTWRNRRVPLDQSDDGGATESRRVILLPLPPGAMGICPPESPSYNGAVLRELGPTAVF